jgi:hypothetical protein
MKVKRLAEILKMLPDDADLIISGVNGRGEITSEAYPLGAVAIEEYDLVTKIGIPDVMLIPSIRKKTTE